MSRLEGPGNAVMAICRIGCVDCNLAFCNRCSITHECFEESVQRGGNNSYCDSSWTPPPSPRESSVTSCSTGGTSGGTCDPYGRLLAAWGSGQSTDIWSGTLSALVFRNECLSSCFLYDAEYCFRHFGTENMDWASLSLSLWPQELPLGFPFFRKAKHTHHYAVARAKCIRFLLFWLDERETWSISARSTPEIVGIKSALCYAKQTGVLPLALRRGEGGDLEIANVFVAGPCAITNWHRHRSMTRVSNRLISCLVASFCHVCFWRCDA